MRLSVIVPVYNEVGSVEEIAHRALAEEATAQLILVDDGSDDGTPRALEALREADGRVELLSHRRNRGKGAAIRTAIPHCREDAVLIQDADLEYDPRHYGRLLAPIAAGEADATYGSRYLLADGARGQRLSNRMANHLITRLSNRFTGLDLTDVETCYKCFRRDVLGRIEIEQSGFGVEIELTAAVARIGCRVIEVPIDYRGRSRVQGKKIGLRDGLEALWLILRYAARDR